MQSGILILHILVCLFLIILILLQSGREGMGVIFGGGGNSSVFGSQGAGGILVKLTTFLAVMFVVTSLGYNILTANKNNVSSVLDVQFEENAAAPAPVQAEDVKEEKAPAAGTIINKDAPKTEENAPAAAPAAPAPAKENVQEEKAGEKAPEKTGALSDTKNLVAYNIERAISNEIKSGAKQQVRQHQRTTKMNNTGINPNSQKKQKKQQHKQQRNTQPQQTQPSGMNYNEG